MFVLKIIQPLFRGRPVTSPFFFLNKVFNYYQGLIWARVCWGEVQNKWILNICASVFFPVNFSNQSWSCTFLKGQRRKESMECVIIQFLLWSSFGLFRAKMVWAWMKGKLIKFDDFFGLSQLNDIDIFKFTIFSNRICWWIC